jgi:hypothetical protein
LKVEYEHGNNYPKIFVHFIDQNCIWVAKNKGSILEQPWFDYLVVV